MFETKTEKISQKFDALLSVLLELCSRFACKFYTMKCIESTANESIVDVMDLKDEQTFVKTDVIGIGHKIKYFQGIVLDSTKTYAMTQIRIFVLKHVTILYIQLWIYFGRFDTNTACAPIICIHTWRFFELYTVCY